MSSSTYSSSSSSSSSNRPRMKYDVFVSFRSRDTRDNFVSHLCGSLRRKRIKTFLYDEVAAEDRLKVALQAIEESRISVIVFSENFADSKWCLDEVVDILKCKDRFKQVVIPILYHVDPLDIENQTGSFGDGFAKRQDEADKLQEWKSALVEATNLVGWSTASIRNEEMLINEIVQDIENKLSRISRKKAIIGWTLLVTNFLLEIPSAIFDQLSSAHKPLYALVGMLTSLLSVLFCLVDLVHKGRSERVRWQWSWPLPWFHYPSPSSKRFGGFADAVGLFCTLCQCTLTIINYSFMSHGANTPIKISVWPLMFALALLCSKFI